MPTTMKENRRFPLTWLRRLSQALFLLLFFFLFIKTDYTGSDRLEYAVNIIFRLDPFLATSVMLAVKTFVALLAPALVVIVLSIFMGRFFCSWICPMGALLDLLHPLVKARQKRIETLAPAAPYAILAFSLTGAVLGLPLAGYFDPFSILVRGLAVSLFPGLDRLLTTFFTWTYQDAPQFVNLVSEPVYATLKATILPLDHKYFAWSLLSGGVLVAVFLLELVQRRFFCRNLCPLGALLGLTARVGLLHGRGGSDACGQCRTCRTVCRMGAVQKDRRIAMERCTLCLDCRDECPRQIISFGVARPQEPAPAVSLSRRVLLGSMAGSALLTLGAGARSLARVPDPTLIRPPGALPEPEFLRRCIRCGECMKVCIGNGLHPTLLEAGFEGMFSPRLIPRIGYCEFNCTLCGQVCPTGAIQELELAVKQRTKIGHAFFDRNRCLPHAKGIPCIVCEEHCPTPDKAIGFRRATVINDRNEKVEVKQPYIIDRYCIGCGICTNKCPLPDGSAIHITAAGEKRNPEKSLPLSSATANFPY